MGELRYENDMKITGVLLVPPKITMVTIIEVRFGELSQKNMTEYVSCCFK